MLAVVHSSLAAHDHLPGEHLVDMDYTAAEVLLASQRDYGVTIVGPVADDPSWQARAGTGFDKSQFVVDWERRVVTCPDGKQSVSWLPHANATTGTHGRRASPSATARRAHCALAVRGPRGHAWSASNSVTATRSCSGRASTRRPRRSGQRTRRGPAWRARMPRPSGAAGSARRATSG